MIYSFANYTYYTIALIGAFVISLYCVRKTLFLTRKMQIFDVPDDIRKIHGAVIPSLGGIGVFIGYTLISVLFSPWEMWKYVILSSLLLFFGGIYDDLMNMRPSKKLLLQLIASAITIYAVNIRVTSFCGIFGIWELPYWYSVGFTILCCTFFINVFNFVDGIDGLACSFGILYSVVLGLLFAINGDIWLACISLSLTGACIGLLYYNIAPAKIYMGDTGSMFVGFIIFVLSVLFINAYDKHGAIVRIIHSNKAALLITLSVIFLPVFDAIRVFIARGIKGISPLKADRNHLHYYLLDAGSTHSGALLILLCANIVVMIVAFLMQNMNSYLVITCMVLLMSVISGGIYSLRKKTKNTSV